MNIKVLHKKLLNALLVQSNHINELNSDMALRVQIEIDTLFAEFANASEKYSDSNINRDDLHSLMSSLMNSMRKNSVGIAAILDFTDLYVKQYSKAVERKMNDVLGYVGNKAGIFEDNKHRYVPAIFLKNNINSL